MNLTRYIRIIAIVVAALLISGDGIPLRSQTRETVTQGQRKKKGTSQSRKGSSKSKNVSKKSKKGSRQNQSAKKETAAEMRKRQESTAREIQLTKEQIRENEKFVKLGLNELGKLQTDIGESKKKVDATASEVKGLDKKIGTLEADIAEGERSLNFMRDQYRAAIKKVRANRHGNSTLAFIFSSENFNQALRRMRYLKKFSEWKDKRSKEIEAKVSTLRKQTNLLAATRSDKQAALRRQEKAKAELETQYSKQDAIVVELKKNGAALRSHLSKKQAEANQLRNRISELIAAEQREAAERERKAEEERLRIEREKAAERERLRAAEEKSAKEAAKEVAQQEVAELPAKDKKEKSEKPKKEQKTSKGKNYADARKRRPRRAAKDNDMPKSGTTSSKSEAAKEATLSKSSAAAPGKAKGGAFAGQRGSLPRPVAGEFRITSPFGRHSLPELPDIMYDNPGIDAEVAAGATASAVYPGKVSGVYVIPGFSTVVIVNHGEYYTVYGNIASPAVKVGDSVNQGQGLGRLAPDEDNPSKSMIHFEVWKNRDKLNPTDWIR